VSSRVPKIRARPPPGWLLEHTDRNLHQVGPSPATLAGWAAAGLALPDLPVMRRYRVARVREQLERNDCDAALLYDPLNIRYVADSTNMSVWTMHNAVRFAFVATDGPLVMFEYSNGEFLSLHAEVVDEIRPARSLHPFYVGDRIDEIAGSWADEIVELIDASSRSGGRRLAVDTLSLEAIRALEARDVCLVAGQRIMEDARLVKSPDEIAAMRLACHSCDDVVGEMRAALRPGMTEVELWSMLHVGNWQRFGEWVETRLLSSGARTNPWYQEASSKVIEAGELVAFDTDLVGAYGMCVDMSRTWRCGGGTPSPAQLDLFARAVASIEANIPLFVPGASYREITERLVYPPVEEFNGYTVMAHGVGLCDEYPSIYTREQWDATGFDGVIEAGNVISVESFVGRRGGGEGVKLEQQVLVTDDGPELLSLDPLGL
jgi:Xaa-Pro aminopeptidase